MSPTWAKKGSKRWRYYVSQAAQQGDKSKAASILRVPAADVGQVLKEILRMRKQDEDERDEQDSLLDLYMRAMQAAETAQAKAA